jgi:CRISPR-associated endonuclease/helicase Cas3
MPTDARYLIESVFGEESAIPVGLQQSNLTVIGQQMADASQAKNNTLTFAAGYKRGDVMDWWSEAKTPSRLGEQSMNIVLARWESERLVPWVNRNHAWAYSTARIAERLIATAYLPADNKKRAEYERVLDTLPDKGKWSVLLPFEKNKAGIWTVQAWAKESKYKPANLLTWQYDAGAGLRLLEENTDKEGGTE